MHLTLKRLKLKTLMLPIAMVCGALFAPWMGYLTFLSPYLIFTMLFITYCKLKISDFKPNKFEISLLGIQMALASAAYGLTFFWNRTLAEGVFICFFIPTATAAPVITAMLGGSISRVATYSLMCNAVVAVAGPVVLAAIGEHAEMTFFESFKLIMLHVFPLIVMPLVVALLLRYSVPRLHAKIVGMQQLSFYLWAVALFIVVGSCVSFAVKNWTPEATLTMVLLALGALIACLVQFKVGRIIGGRFGDKVSGGQGLGQKNTVLAVWLALAYLNPMASIAPAAYVAWQNSINSWQLMRHERKKRIDASPDMNQDS